MQKSIKKIRAIRCATLFILALAMALIAAPATAIATLFVVNTGSVGTVGAYTDSGATINASLITGLSRPQFVAVSGGFLYVGSIDGTIGKYTTAGATVNASLITGLSGPLGIEISGEHLFVTNFGNGTVGEYTTSGATVNASLITDLTGPIGLAVSGAKLFVSGNFGVAEYTTSGAVVDASLIPDIQAPFDIEVSGSNLFVSHYIGDDVVVGKYGLDGTTLDPALITLDSTNAQAIAVSGSDLFARKDTTIGKFTTSGAVITDPLISGLREGFTFGFAVESLNSVPETFSSWWFALTATGLLGLARARAAKQTA